MKNRKATHERSSTRRLSTVLLVLIGSLLLTAPPASAAQPTLHLKRQCELVGDFGIGSVTVYGRGFTAGPVEVTVSSNSVGDFLDGVVADASGRFEVRSFGIAFDAQFPLEFLRVTAWEAFNPEARVDRVIKHPCRRVRL